MSTQYTSQYNSKKTGPYNSNKTGQYNSNKTSQYNSNNKFCKICYDAGKDKSVYSSHYVKSDSIVICPTLKATECRYCRKLGHTIKFCKVLNEKNNYFDNKSIYYTQKKMEPLKPVVKIGNMFESLTSRWSKH